MVWHPAELTESIGGRVAIQAENSRSGALLSDGVHTACNLSGDPCMEDRH